MAFNWRKFPWTNLHELNLDWIIQTVKALEDNLADTISSFREMIDAAISNTLTGSGDLTINKTGSVNISGNSVKLSKTVISAGNEQLTMRNTTSNTSMGANYNNGVLQLLNNQNEANGVALYAINTPADGGGDNSKFAANVGYVNDAVNAVQTALAAETSARESAINSVNLDREANDSAIRNTINNNMVHNINISVSDGITSGRIILDADTIAGLKSAIVKNRLISLTITDNTVNTGHNQTIYFLADNFTIDTNTAEYTIEFVNVAHTHTATITTADETLAYERLSGQPVSGVVDANNNIIISGSLADGTYTIKYENADGTYTDIGTFEVGATDPVYTNLFDPVAATLNQRWSNSSYAFTTGNGNVVSDYIPLPDISNSSIEHILRFRGGTWAGQAGIIYYNSSKGVLQASDASSAGVGINTASDTPTTDENGVSQLTLGHKHGAYDSAWASAAYIRITLQINSTSTAITADDIQGVIITIDEPIV